MHHPLLAQNGAQTQQVQSGDSHFLPGSFNVGGTGVPIERLEVAGVVAIKSQASSPSATAAYGKVYVKTDKKLYYKDEDGNEFDLAATGAGMAIGGSIAGGATPGSVLFVGTGPVLAQDNADFFWDNTNKFLGIGTNAPGASLHILGSVNDAIVSVIENDTSGSAARVVQVFEATGSGFPVNFATIGLHSAAFVGGDAVRLPRQMFITSGADTINGIVVATQIAGAPFAVWTTATSTLGASKNSFSVKNTEVVVNEDAQTTSLRVESSGNSTMFVVDASANFVGIGTVPTALLHVKGTYPHIKLDTSAASADVGLLMFNNSGATFRGGWAYDSAQDVTSFYGPLASGAATVNITAAGDVAFVVDDGPGGSTAANPDTLFNGTNDATAGAWIFNQRSTTTADFQVKGSTVPFLIFADVSANFVGIGTSTPGFELHVVHNQDAATLFVVENTSGGSSAFTGFVALEDGPSGKFFSAQYLNSGFPVAGLQLPNQGKFVAAQGATGGMLFEALAGPIKFVQGGIATTDEKFSILSTEAVFNEPGIAYNLRVESDTQDHALFLDASLDSGHGRWGFFDSTPDALVDIDGGTLPAGIPAFGITASFPASASSQIGVSSTITTTSTTGNGTGSQYGAIFTLANGGWNSNAGNSVALNAENDSVGTGTWNPLNGGQVAATDNSNDGTFGSALGSTAGTNIGARGQAILGGISIGAVNGVFLGGLSGSSVFRQDSLNIGSLSFVTATKHASSTTEQHIGVYGAALGGDINVAGYFGLRSTAPTFASAALVADNGTTSSDIFVAIDGTTPTTVFRIANGGDWTLAGQTTATIGAGADGVASWEITGTLFNVTTGTNATYGIREDWSSQGSGTTSNVGHMVVLGAGYAGSGATIAVDAENSGAASTGNDLGLSTNANPRGNSGINGFSYSTTTGLNVGVMGAAQAGDLNVALAGKATVLKNGATNIGVIGFGRNTGTSPIQVGGWFSLANSTPTWVSAALVADNSDQTSPIFLAIDGTGPTTVFTIADGATAVTFGTGFDRDASGTYAIGGTNITTLTLGRSGQTQALAGDVTHAATLVMSADSTYTPATDNTGKVGTGSNRFAEVHAVTVTTGDLEMKSPGDNGASAHWRLLEERDRIVAINVLTGKKYALALTEIAA